MKKIKYIVIPSILYTAYLYYYYTKDKYVKSLAYDKYKNIDNKIINNIQNIEYHCVETYYRFYTEYKKYFYDVNGEINQIEITYKYRF
jgi:hypothetical protein